MTDQKKILGIDYGEKRVGVAISDETLNFSFGLKVIENKGDQNLIKEIKRIVSENEIDKIVIGLPKTLAGEEGESAKNVRVFAEALSKGLNIEVEFEDERLSTEEVKKRLHEKGLKEKDMREKIDKEASRAILPSYLDRIK